MVFLVFFLVFYSAFSSGVVLVIFVLYGACYIPVLLCPFFRTISLHGGASFLYVFVFCSLSLRVFIVMPLVAPKTGSHEFLHFGPAFFWCFLLFTAK